MASGMQQVYFDGEVCLFFLDQEAPDKKLSIQERTTRARAAPLRRVAN
jgi:hypothetical protein